MKKLFFIASFIIAFFCHGILSAQNYLNVNDPQNWGWGQGTIEEAVISIKPCGIYMEYELFLTFSARGTWFNSTDTLEVVLNFELPEGSIVHDSWLWFGEEILKGRILDRWTASSIYEEIVDRRQDPSILVKNSATDYQLNIFPMAANETRKVKITYLAPARWTKESIYAEIPTAILRTSQNHLDNFTLITWPDELYGNPRVDEFGELNFEQAVDENQNTYLRMELPREAVDQSLNFAVNSALKNGVFLGTTNYNDENYYQLAFLPGEVLNLSEGRKIAVMINFVSSNSSISDDDLLQQIKSLLHQNLSPNDMFNLFFAKFNILQVGETWITADSASIEETFESLGDNPISNYSSLPSLFSEAIEFLNENDGGLLFLISNSDQEGDFIASNQLIEDIRTAMDEDYPIFIADIQDENLRWHWIGNRSYYGNEYFYTNLSRLTTGSYKRVDYGSIPSTLMSAFTSLSGYISYFDLYTRITGGSCYARFNFMSQDQTVYLNSPVYQIGKFQGILPMTVDVSGLYEEDVFFDSKNIENEDANEMDSLTAKIWLGNYINMLEGQQSTNDVIDNILGISINERILSKYSAFLCLEPAQDSLICWDCIEGGNDYPTSVEDDGEENEEDTELSLSSYPNPFNNQATIILKVPAATDVSKLIFKIYNILGQVVYTFDPVEGANSNEIRLTWNGMNDSGRLVSSGTYIFVAIGLSKIHSLKLNYVK